MASCPELKELDVAENDGIHEAGVEVLARGLDLVTFDIYSYVLAFVASLFPLFSSFFFLCICNCATFRQRSNRCNRTLELVTNMLKEWILIRECRSYVRDIAAFEFARSPLR